MSLTSVLVYLRFMIDPFVVKRLTVDEYHQMKMDNKGLNNNRKETLKELGAGNPQGGKNQAWGETKKEILDNPTKEIKYRAAAARSRNC